MTPEAGTQEWWARIAPCPTCEARSGAPCEGGATHGARLALAGPLGAVVMLSSGRGRQRQPERKNKPATRAGLSDTDSRTEEGGRSRT